MTFSFSDASEDRLKNLVPNMVRVVRRTLSFGVMDFTVLETLRDEERQKMLVAAGDSETENSRHLPNADGLAEAVDLLPYPYTVNGIDVWKDTRHVAASGASNIRLRDLNDISAFRELKQTLFDHTRDVAALRAIPPEELTFEHQNIWGRVDLARLLVLRHALENSAARDVIYSDFDAADVCLDNPEAQDNLEKYGMTFGLAPASDTGKHDRIENGYLAFRHNRMDRVLLDRILSKTEDEVAAGYNGYSPFYQELKSWCEDRNIPDFPTAISIPLLPSMRYEIPKSKPQPLKHE